MTLNKLLVGIIYLSLAIAVALALSCSKPVEDQRCYFACLISDKYTKDSVFVARDSIWKDECLSKYWYDKTKAASDSMPDMFRHCTPFVRNGQVVEKERLFYVLSRVNVEPKVY